MKTFFLIITSIFFCLVSCKPETVKNKRILNNQSKNFKSNIEKEKSTKQIDKKEIENGIKITYFDKGKGEHIFDNDVLMIDYEVYLKDGKFVDGNKLLNKKWLPFIVGFQLQTPGWDIALRYLQIGDSVEIFLPSKMARGKNSIKGLIPPHSDNYIRLRILGKLKPNKIVDGVKVWVLEENKLEKIKANTENQIEFHYMVSTPSNPKYDISYTKNLPYVLKFSDFGIIKGLKKGLLGSKTSDKLWILIPPNQAYGMKGLINLIKPNEFVFYDIFILNVR